MTSRERTLAAARGGSVDRRPVLGWPGSEVRSDIGVTRLSAEPAFSDDRFTVAEVLNPFGFALADGLDLNELLANDLDEGNRLLDQYVGVARDSIAKQLDAGHDGVLYRVHGARAGLSTPMQYGGYHLERDRELLEEIQDANLNIVFVVGDDDVYLDFVSDLPAHVFAWDSQASGIRADYVRELRQGALASTDDTSEFLLDSGVDSVARTLESSLA